MSVGKKVLIVDDDATIVLMLTENFKAENYEVHTAEEGQSAFGIAQTIKPDVIILDYNMPGLNGVQVSQLLRKDEQTRWIPIIFLTGQEIDATMKILFNQAGMSHVKKPIELDVLNQLVSFMISKFPAC